jgi:hypothetical protein
MVQGSGSFFAKIGRGLRPSWRAPLFDRALAILAVLVAIGTAILVAKSAEELLNVAIIGLILSNVVMSWLVFFLARENTALASSKNITENDAIKIAVEFRNLSSKQCDYESAVASFVMRFVSTKDTDDDWNRLVAALNAFVECVCDTAVQVITKKKGYTPDNASANIKTFTTAPDDTRELVYQVFRRSRNSDVERDRADEETRKKEFRVHTNRMYDSILKTRRHVFIPNLAKYLEETARLNLERIESDEHPYKEPSKKVLSFLNSGMVLPIQGRDATLKTLDMPEKIIPYEGGWSLLGTFCIDSKNVGFFDEEYDLHVMSQLSSHAFSALRTYYLVTALKNSRLAARIATGQPHAVAVIDQKDAQGFLPSA